MSCTYQQQNQKKDKHNIIKIPDILWDESSTTLPDEKPNNTIGNPIITYRKVMNEIMYILRTGCQWRMLFSKYSFGSTYHR